METLMAELPKWIAPGDAATLLWYSGKGESPDGVPVYEVSGPAMETPPASPYFLLAPADRGDFAGELYRGRINVPELRAFLSTCVLARGELNPSLEWVAAPLSSPVLTVIDGWRALGERPVLAYLSDIGAFLPGDRPLFVTPEAHAAAQETAEQFATAWVCDECGEAEDAGVFLWTVRGEGTVRVCFLIHNDAGIWTCRLHPFEFDREAA
ncbi:MAG TPA: hypothetical protein VNS56_05455 [Methylomirabilota bacterium]|nr:hypothetical protein [Methylomirabilota bacterium]